MENCIFKYWEFSPQVDETVYLAPGCKIIGNVKIGAESSVWYNTVVRGDVGSIEIGRQTNIQDCCSLHEDAGYPLIIGDRVSVGHNCVLHGCTIGDGALIGMGAIVMNGARVGKGAVVAAGATVPSGREVPDYHLALGSPAKVVRAITEEEKEDFTQMAARYLARSRFCLGQAKYPGF